MALVLLKFFLQHFRGRLSLIVEMRRRRTPRGLLNFDYSCLPSGVPPEGGGRGVYTEAGCILVGGTVVMPRVAVRIQLPLHLSCKQSLLYYRFFRGAGGGQPSGRGSPEMNPL